MPGQPPSPLVWSCFDPRRAAAASCVKIDLKPFPPSRFPTCAPNSSSRRFAGVLCILAKGYDGGDCCSCTCVPPTGYEDDAYTCSEQGSGFACIDPAAECVGDDDITVEMVEGCGSAQSIGMAGVTHSHASCFSSTTYVFRVSRCTMASSLRAISGYPPSITSASNDASTIAVWTLSRLCLNVLSTAPIRAGTPMTLDHDVFIILRSLSYYCWRLASLDREWLLRHRKQQRAMP